VEPEHTWSKSHGDFGESRPAGTDLHHMRPCDATVNSAKGNKDFDEGGNEYIDASPYSGYSGATGNYTTSSTWEPRDEEKGDVARMIM
jgi:endonuclease I